MMSSRETEMFLILDVCGKCAHKEVECRSNVQRKELSSD